MFTVKVIPEFSGVRQGLDHAVHEARVAKVDQSRETREAHLLLLLLFVALNAGGKAMGHGLDHAGGLRLRQEARAWFV